MKIVEINPTQFALWHANFGWVSPPIKIMNWKIESLYLNTEGKCFITIICSNSRKKIKV